MIIMAKRRETVLIQQGGSSINLTTVGLVIGAMLLLAVATGTDIGSFFNNVQGKDDNGNPFYTVTASANFRGILIQPRILIRDITYDIKESGFLGTASVVPMNIGGAVSVRGKAQLIQDGKVIRESGWKNMGDFGLIGSKTFSFTITKVPIGDYTLKIKVKYDDPIGENSEDIEISVG